MTNRPLGFSYPPKIEPVRTFKCTQSIRIGWKTNVGDEKWIFAWSGRPYRSPWAWKHRVRIHTVLHMEIIKDGSKDGFELQIRDGKWEPDYYPWDSQYADHLSKLDYINPPKGTELGRLLTSMHKLFKGWEPPSRYEFEVIRWKGLVQQKIYCMEYPECEHFRCARQHGEKVLNFNWCRGHEPWSCKRTQREGECRNEEIKKGNPKGEIGEPPTPRKEE